MQENKSFEDRTLVIPASIIPYGSWYSRCYTRFLNHAEKAIRDENYYQDKQIIPYIVLLNQQDKIFTYKRFEHEARLSDLVSIGVGGHIQGDEDLVTCAQRELLEETGIDIKHRLQILGVINSDKSPVDRAHIGFPIFLRVTDLTPRKEGKFPLNIDDPEAWKTDAEIRDLPNLETWSYLSLDLMDLILRNERR
jgi:predicted NUDIX family phosphoesterase